MEQSKIAFAVGAAAGATALLLVQRWQRRRPRPATAGCVEGNPGFRVEGEEREVYRRFLAVYDRKVVYPDGRAADFDIVGHPRSYHFVCVFVFHTADRSVTLLREFAQAGLPEAALVFGLACGRYDPRKHRSAQHAAESELSEEAQLEGGRWTRLLPADHPGVLEAKWCRNRFTPFLCVDPQPAAHPLPRDAEEHVEVLRMPTEQLRPNPDPNPNPNPNPTPTPTVNLTRYLGCRPSGCARPCAAARCSRRPCSPASWHSLTLKGMGSSEQSVQLWALSLSSRHSEPPVDTAIGLLTYVLDFSVLRHRGRGLFPL